MTVSSETLPLLYTTPDRWADSAVSDLALLLSDHAYLERKAASNALDLLNRWPQTVRAAQWIGTITAIARDEAIHLQSVARLLKERGGELERLHKSQYASDLRKLVRAGEGPSELIDRLLVSALIEARSCERFGILARRCPDAELGSFYAGLWSSEMGHYRLFLELARSVSEEEADWRWREVLAREAEIIQRQPVGPRLHSSVPMEPSA